MRLCLLLMLLATQLLRAQAVEAELGSVRGRVVDAAGQPVAGLLVSCDSTHGISGFATTDADGHYQADRVGAGPVTAKLRWGRRSADPVTGVVQADALTELPDLRLDQRLVPGRMTKLPAGLRAEQCWVVAAPVALDAAGRRLPDSAACLLPGLVHPLDDLLPDDTELGACELGYLVYPGAKALRMALPEWLPGGEQPTFAKADGSFVVPLEPGRHRLMVRTHWPHGPGTATITVAEATVDIPADGPARLDLPVTLGTCVLRGTWLRGGLVAAYRGPGLMAVAVAPVAEDGAWHIDGLPPGEYRLGFSEGNGTRFASVTAREGQTTTVAPPAKATGVLRGRLTGKLPAKVVVSAEGDGAARAAEVGRDGRFAISGLPDGSYRLSVWSPAGVHRLPDPASVPGPEVVFTATP